MAEGGGFDPPEGVNLLRFSRPPQSAALPLIRLVEPVGLEPTLPPCKGGVLPLNYGPVKIMVGAAGIEPAPPCSQSRCAASALRSELAASPMPTAPATMATFLLGFRTNHRGPSPGNDQR